MKVFHSVLVASALCTAFAGTASAGQGMFGKEVAKFVPFVKKIDGRKSHFSNLREYGAKKGDHQKFVREAVRKLKGQQKRGYSWKHKNKSSYKKKSSWKKKRNYRR